MWLPVVSPPNKREDFFNFKHTKKRKRKIP